MDWIFFGRRDTCHSGTGKQEQTTFKGKVICKTLYQTQLQIPIILITRPYLVK